MKVQADYSTYLGMDIDLDKPGRYTYELFSVVDGESKGELISLSGGFNVISDVNRYYQEFEERDVEITEDGFTVKTPGCSEVLKVKFKEPIEDIKMPVVVNNFTLDAFEGILRFPEEVLVNSNLLLNNVWYLKDIPYKLVVKGDCTISNCFYLTEIPDSWEIHGAATFSNNPRLVWVRGKIFRNSLDLSYCENLPLLPHGLTVKGNLDLSHCKSLTKLPTNLSVKRDLILNGCVSLKEIPSSIHVGGKRIREY